MRRGVRWGVEMTWGGWGLKRGKAQTKAAKEQTGDNEKAERHKSK
jgi:hypothetical protein